MIQALAKRRSKDDEGFTLIELMVVILIIAILLAIAIPTFLGAQNRAKDRAAQSDLRNALTAAKTLATDQEGFFKTSAGVLTPANMFDAESSLTFIATAAAATTVKIGMDVGSVTPNVGDNIIFVKQTKAKGGAFWGIAADKDGTVKYCKSAANPPGLTFANCDKGSFADAS